MTSLLVYVRGAVFSTATLAIAIHALGVGVWCIVSCLVVPATKLARSPTSVRRLAVVVCFVLLPGCWAASAVRGGPIDVSGRHVCMSQQELVQLHTRVLTAEARAKIAEERAHAAEAQVKACPSSSNRRCIHPRHFPYKLPYGSPT